MWTTGARLAGFIKRNIIYCYKQNMKALGLVVSEKKIFLCFNHDPPPRAGPVWTTGARLAGFIQRATIHCYIQNMKALDLVIWRRRFCYVLPMTPPGGARMDPRGTVGRMYKEDHYTLLHTKYESSGPCDFREEDFWALWFWRRRFFLCFSHDNPGAGPVWTTGAR